MEDLIKVLEKTVSNLQTDQNEATKFIQDYMAWNVSGFLKALSDILLNQENLPVVRAAAGLQLKNQLTSRDETIRHQQQERWRNLPDSDREYIKTRVFETLGTEVFRPSSAPQCVAYIAILELPDNKWPELIDKLSSNVTKTHSSSIQLASLEAIGYICQDIDQTCLNVNDSNRILSAIVQCMADECPIDVKSAATTALLKFCETAIREISYTHQSITFDQLGQYLRVDPNYAEIIVAQMIREERIQGHLNQIERIIYFDSKDIIKMFDEEILKLCSEVNSIIEKIRLDAPEEWWAGVTV